MHPHVEKVQVIGASIAFGTVVAFQLAYCLLKCTGKLHVPDRTRLWYLVGNACVLTTLGTVCIAMLVGFWKYASLIIAVWKGVSVLSIWSFEVLDVLYPSKHILLLHQNAPLSSWGDFVFWIGLATQCVFGCLGAWQLGYYGIELMWAIPIVSHINVAALASYALVFVPDDKAARTGLLLWAITGTCVSVASGILLVGSALGWVTEQAAAQCLLCMVIVSTTAARDWFKAKDEGLGLPQNQPFDLDTVDRGFSKSTVSESRQRVDSAIDLLTLDCGSSQLSFNSTTTLCSEVCRRYKINEMQFPEYMFSPFRVDSGMQSLMPTIHAFYCEIYSGKLLPEQVGGVKSILDVGTGTGDWAMDVAQFHEDISVIGTDLAPIQPQQQLRNLVFYVEDANQPGWGWHDRFDYIHFRSLDGGIKDWAATLKTAFKCLRSGGFINLTDIVYCSPIDSATSNSTWELWLRMLGALKDKTGFSFGIHTDGRARRTLQDAGYNIVHEDKQPFQLEQRTKMYDNCDLLQSFVEQMKGIFARALEFETHSVEQHRELVQRFGEDLLQQGLRIEVVRIIAMKPEAALQLSAGARTTNKASADGKR